MKRRIALSSGSPFRLGESAGPAWLRCGGHRKAASGAKTFAGKTDGPPARCPATASGQDFLERLDHHLGIHPGGPVGSASAQFLRRGQGIEFGDDQAAGEAGGARVVAVDRRVRAGEYQAAFFLQLFETGQVGRAAGQAAFLGSGMSRAMIA